MINELGTLGRGVGVAIEAAIKTERLKLAIKLLKRVKQNKTLQVGKQTLLHTLAQESTDSKGNQDPHTEIVQLLVNHEVDIWAGDSLNSNAIIYAAINWNLNLLNQLTDMMTVNRVVSLEPDLFFRTPLSAIFWSKDMWKSNGAESELSEELQKWCLKLLENGAQINVLSHYPITESLYPGVRFVSSSSTIPSPSSPKYSPLIASVISGNYSIVKYLLNLKINGSFIVDVNFADSLGKTPLMHAVRLVSVNNTYYFLLLKFRLQNTALYVRSKFT